MATKKRMTLLVMAAGMGSRYGGIKQIDGFGPNGETIMDYSLFDALRAGFDKVVFIVRDEIKETVKEIFLPKLKGKAEVFVEVQRVRPSVQETGEENGSGRAFLGSRCGRDRAIGPRHGSLLATSSPRADPL